MPGTIRQYIKRRIRLTAAILVGGMLLLLYLVQHRDQPGARAACVAVFCATAVGLLWATWVKCPRCGYFFSRNDFARFAWPFLDEPDQCPRCSVSLDDPYAG
jgi:hypothetical protein